jgi:ATP-dependent DNA helicase UvrD/PcrA
MRSRGSFLSSFKLMENELIKAVNELTPIQKHAATWSEGPMLVLAGPGSGKTRVLTTRIGLLLEQTTGRILALTYTTKAADEMRSRVRTLSPEGEDRVLVGTFHSFCVNVLRQHGIHIGIRSSFSIYSRDEDRLALLIDTLRSNAREDLIPNASRYLKAVDTLRGRLMGSASAAKIITGVEAAKTVAYVYDIYEKALHDNGILDFYSMIFETCRLLKMFPAISKQYRGAYQYWLLDEFQDTTPAQYFLIKTLAGRDFKNLFIVADDDQIIYQWNGASYRQIENFSKDYEPTLIQLPTNFRCPPAIVDAANLLVANNTFRAPEKKSLEAGKTETRHPRGAY